MSRLIKRAPAVAALVSLSALFTAGCEDKKPVPRVEPPARVSEPKPEPMSGLELPKQSEPVTLPPAIVVDAPRPVIKAVYAEGPEFTLTLPDGVVVTVDVDRLGPHGELTVGFVYQLDPHSVRDESMLKNLSPDQAAFMQWQWASIDSKLGSTDEKLIAALMKHLQVTHQLTAEKVEQVRLYCVTLIARRSSAPTVPQP